MPAIIKIIHTQDFIRVEPDGTVDFATSNKLLKDLVAEIDTSGNYHILVDTRGADVHLSTTDIFELGGAVAEEPSLTPDTRFALLVPLDEKGDADFFETVSSNRGVNLRAFTDFESAITWLIVKE